MKNFFLSLLVAGMLAPVSSMVITPMTDAQTLAQNLVGPGITISNVTYTGAVAASGYFEGGSAAGIGIEQGIVLTTGLASNLNGITNTADDIEGDNNLSGDIDLEALIPGFDTYDATVLEFDFVSIGDAAYFNYVFGSEEYNEYVGWDYNDVFGFFLDDDNVALIPGTSTPVTIDNVNNGVNSAYYNDNDFNYGTFPFEYDGFTTPLTASMTGLIAGNTYHIKLAIADTEDWYYDSGVFLQAGSFSGTQTIPEPASMLLLGLGILGMVVVKRRKK